jgi:DNA polymerase-3 subunit gamma/tau
MQTRSLSYKAALQDLATLLHQLSIAQVVPAAIADDMPDRSEILRLAALFDAGQIQLFYQIAVHGRNELGLAPDEYAGFSMTLLRMLAFQPVTSEFTNLLNAPPAPTRQTVNRPAAPARIAEPVRPRMQLEVEKPATASSGKKSPAMVVLEAMQDRRSKGKTAEPAANSSGNEFNAPAFDPGVAEKKTELKTEPGSGVADLPGAAQPIPAPAIQVKGVFLNAGGEWDGNWPLMSASLPLRGVAQQLAQQSELISCEVAPNVITLGLRIPLETLLASDSVEKLAASLAENFTVPVRLITEIGAVKRTASAAAIVERAVRQEAAEVAIKSDQIVQGLMRVFGATIVPGSVKSVN